MNKRCADHGLEVETATKQHISRGIGTRTLSEVSVLQVCIDTLIIHTVENIEGIESNLEIHPLRDWSHFLQREVHVSIAGITKLIRHLVAFRADHRKGKVATRHYATGARR